MSEGAGRAFTRSWRTLSLTWRRIRGWRRIRFTAGGGVFTVGTLAVGFAAMNTGNNLLYLLLGSMLGIIAISGWLSEQAIRGLEIERRRPAPVTVGQPLRITYTVRNTKPRLPSLAVEIFEDGLPDPAFLPRLAPGTQATTRSVNTLLRRGVYPLRTVTLSTSFPFGLFRKERDLELPGEAIVRPRHDRPVGGTPARRRGSGEAGASTHARGARGEYRALREYRSGDDRRDIHWRSSAKLAAPMVREFDREGASPQWICLDTRGPAGERAEEAVETAASTASRALAQGRPFGLLATGAVVGIGEGPPQLERVLDALAGVAFGVADPPPPLPPDGADHILVAVTGHPGSAS